MNIEDVKVGNLYYWGTYSDNLWEKFTIVEINDKVAVCEYLMKPEKHYYYYIESILRSCTLVYIVEGFEV